MNLDSMSLDELCRRKNEAEAEYWSADDRGREEDRRLASQRYVEIRDFINSKNWN
jgi:hypothetical protein